MPIYEYRCDHCTHQLEAIQKISDPPLKSCPECSRDALRRLISAPTFRLKGKGWYETDFKKDGQRNLHQAESKSESSTESKGESKSGSSETGSATAKAGDSKPASTGATPATGAKATGSD